MGSKREYAAMALYRPDIEPNCNNLISPGFNSIQINFYDTNYNIFGKKISIDSSGDRHIADCPIGEINPTYGIYELCDSI